MYHKLDYTLNISPPKTRTTTFLDYKRTDIYKELNNSLSLTLLDKATFYSVLLDYSYAYRDLVDFLGLYACSHINIGNPNLCIFVWNLYNKINQMPKNFDSFNYQEFRNGLSLLVSICCLSNKIPLNKLTSFKKNDNLDINLYRSLIKRKDFKNIDSIISADDNKIIYIPLNEIDYCLTTSGDNNQHITHALFWLSFLFESEKREALPLCKLRKLENIEEKHSRDVVWLIWKVIFKSLEKKTEHDKLFNIINSLFKLFSSNLTQSNKKKRRVYLIYSVIVTINKYPKIDFNQSYLVNHKDIFKVNMSINQIYDNIYELNTNDNLVSNPEKKPKPKIFIPRKILE